MTAPTDTPRTDGAEFFAMDKPVRQVVDADFARQLERELAVATGESRVSGRLFIEAQSKLEEERKRGDEYGQRYAKLLLEFQKLKQERDQLRAELTTALEHYRDARALDDDVDNMPHREWLRNVAVKLKERDQLRAEVDRLKQCGSCLLAGPGRGDCEHFVGLPPVLDSTTTDTYGKPHGWCWLCWHSYRLSQLRTELEAFKQLHPDYRKEAQ